MLELRVLNGMHRGAALPLDGGELGIGSAEDNDVVLRDPGLLAHHAVIRPDAAGNWVALVATPGGKASIPVAAGTQLDLAGVRLAFVDEGAPWPQDDKPAAPRPGKAQPATARAASGPAPARIAPRRLWLGGAAAAAMLLVIGWSAYVALTGEYESELTLIPSAAAATAQVESLATATQPDSRLEPGTMIDANEIGVDKEKPEAAKPGLPFQLVQIQAGPQAFVVADDDRLLYVNEEHQGFKLVAVEDHRLVFAGTARVEIPW